MLKMKKSKPLHDVLQIDTGNGGRAYVLGIEHVSPTSNTRIREFLRHYQDRESILVVELDKSRWSDRYHYGGGGGGGGEARNLAIVSRRRVRVEEAYPQKGGFAGVTTMLWIYAAALMNSSVAHLYVDETTTTTTTTPQSESQTYGGEIKVAEDTFIRQFHEMQEKDQKGSYISTSTTSSASSVAKRRETIEEPVILLGDRDIRLTLQRASTEITLSTTLYNMMPTALGGIHIVPPINTPLFLTISLCWHALMRDWTGLADTLENIRVHHIQLLQRSSSSSSSSVNNNSTILPTSSNNQRTALDIWNIEMINLIRHGRISPSQKHRMQESFHATLLSFTGTTKEKNTIKNDTSSSNDDDDNDDDDPLLLPKLLPKAITDERDILLAHAITTSATTFTTSSTTSPPSLKNNAIPTNPNAFSDTNNNHVVAVVGKGHLQGILHWCNANNFTANYVEEDTAITTTSSSSSVNKSHKMVSILLPSTDTPSNKLEEEISGAKHRTTNISTLLQGPYGRANTILFPLQAYGTPIVATLGIVGVGKWIHRSRRFPRSLFWGYNATCIVTIGTSLMLLKRMGDVRDRIRYALANA